MDESLNDLKSLRTVVSEEVSVWPRDFSELFELPEEETTPEPHVTKEVSNSAVWKVFLVVSVLLLALVGVLSTVYYLCVWRGGRLHYEQHKEVST
ncbi:hypothetical protein WMY93_020686 [Mugilogobius chulae]|uniref:Uncharacterized protein n=1 Tax=Mugilogobius chulae TaxID=88201 RepID=A0AAW0NKU3_9GOBI